MAAPLVRRVRGATLAEAPFDGHGSSPTCFECSPPATQGDEASKSRTDGLKSRPPRTGEARARTRGKLGRPRCHPSISRERIRRRGQAGAVKVPRPRCV
jgi:hypothetical protein